MRTLENIFNDIPIRNPDVESIFSLINFKYELKKEAIKEVLKYLSEINEHKNEEWFTHCGEYKQTIGLIRWIKAFFNITDEELKNDEINKI